MKDIIVKYSNKNIRNELESIDFDSSYINFAINTYKGDSLKITNLRPAEANILKQLCLSLGFDCAVSRNTITCNCEYTDCLIFASFNGYKKLVEKLNAQPFRLKELSDKIAAVINDKLATLYIRKSIFDWSRPYIMGILNITPDSFSDGGKFIDKEVAIKQAIKLIEDGADIIDIGGESTRPDAKPVSCDEEIKRIIPVIEEIRKNNSDIPISVDTRNFKTAKAAIESGADIINDVSGLNDESIINYICSNNIPAILVHSTQVPAISYNEINDDLIEVIYSFFSKKIETLTKSGLNRSNIILDTGIGFGKSEKECFDILKRHKEFSSLNQPMLLGISRKSFIRSTFNIDCEESDIPTALYSAILNKRNVNIHRVHNVKLVKQYIDYSLNIM